MNINIPTPGSITRDQAGQALLEFAGSMVILVLLYLVIITVGLHLADLAAVNKAARDGGRQTAITGGLADGANKARETAWAWGLDPRRFEVELSMSAYGGRNVVICETTYVSSPLAAWFPTMAGQTAVGEREFRARSIFGWWDVEN